MAYPVEHVIHGFEVCYNSADVCIIGRTLHKRAHLSLDALHLGGWWRSLGGLAVSDSGRIDELIREDLWQDCRPEC